MKHPENFSSFPTWSQAATQQWKPFLKRAILYFGYQLGKRSIAGTYPSYPNFAIITSTNWKIRAKNPNIREVDYGNTTCYSGKQLETWTAIIQECRNSGMKTKDWLAENNISKDQYYYWFKQLRLAACMQSSGPQPELPVESGKPQIVKLECADYQNNLDSCSSSKIRIDRGSIHVEIAGGAAPAVIRSIMEVLVDAE